jgi:lysophospholipase L1-like esterase
LGIRWVLVFAEVGMKRSLHMAGVLAAAVMAASVALAQVAGPGGPAGGGQAAQGAPGARGGGRGINIGARPGPPAEVPEAVKMARPTADEVKQINEELKRLVASDTSSAKPLMEKYASMLHVDVPRLNPAIMAVPRNQQRHADFVEIAKKGDIDLLFEGDSITDWWTRNGKTAYQKYFGDTKVANFAIAGDTTQGVLWGLLNGEGEGFTPKGIMLMVGTNNAGNCSAAEIAEGVGAIVLEDRKRWPDAKILLLAIFPRGGAADPVRDKLAEVNRIISKLDDHQHVFYMDIGSKFLDEKGEFLEGAFLPDRLHPQERGYEIWGEAVKPTLDGFLKG